MGVEKPLETASMDLQVWSVSCWGEVSGNLQGHANSVSQFNRDIHCAFLLAL